MEPLRFNTLDNLTSSNPVDEVTRQALNSIRSTQTDVPHFDLPPHFISPVIEKMEKAKHPDEKIYVLGNQDGQYGPYTADQIKELLISGAVNAEMYVWTQGYPNWEKISACKDFANLFNK